MQALLEDPRLADPRMAALLALIGKLAKRSVTVTQADVDAVRGAGWTDDAIYDAITVCSLFRFYNTWVDGCGVPALPDYEASGKRLATFGYAPQEET